jgi:glutathione peroxidase
MLSTLLTFALAASPATPSTPMSVYDFQVKSIDGKDVSLSAYKGKALMIVNTASKCGFTPQYKGLEELYETYKAKGFEILAFPANEFGAQEPGSNAEIKTFCELKYKTTFPLFEKIVVKGKGQHPLYAYLTGLPENGGEISWNFNKFLVTPEGKVVAHLESKAEPMSPEVKKQVEAILPRK